MAESPARSLDLARGDALRFHGFETELPKIQFEPGFRGAVYSALKGFPEFRSLGLQHN